MSMFVLLSPQETIRREFRHCTVLTIAHRLHTILDSDRVMVLEEGRMVEFDRPGRLLEDQGSRFRFFAQQAKLVWGMREGYAERK